MTIKEAISQLDFLRYFVFQHEVEALDIAIQVLKENAVNNTPVGDVAPVVHAHWIELEEELEPDFQLFDMTDLKGAICSECGYEVGLDIYVWNYCPNCNAKMDEEGCFDGGT